MALELSVGEIKDRFCIEKENSTGVSLLGKRKVETPDVEESGDESDSDDSNWDKDSFDGREYHPSDDSEYSDEDLQRRCRFYNRTVIETKGFFEATDDFPRYRWSGITTVPDLEQEVKKGINGYEFLSKMAIECVEKYNKRMKKTVKFEHFLRANFNPGGKTKFYITFAARESDSLDEPLVEYQAKVTWCAGKTYPILCRPSSSPPKKIEGDGREQLKNL